MKHQGKLKGLLVVVIYVISGSTTLFLECGGIVKGHNGVITSPDWPNLYDDYLYCMWKFTSPKRVQIVDLDIGADKKTCLMNYLRVDNLKYCGDSIDSEEYLLTSVLRFNSKGRNIGRHRGFILIWYLNEDYYNVPDGKLEFSFASINDFALKVKLEILSPFLF